VTTLIETMAGVPEASRLDQALKTRAEIMRLSEAAHDAVIVPREPGGLSHGLRAAFHLIGIAVVGRIIQWRTEVAQPFGG